MSCDAIRQRLLTSEQPGRPADDLRPHLTACPGCRRWLRRLVDLERDLASLPVPPSPAGGDRTRRVLERLKPAAARPRETARPQRPWQTSATLPRERGYRKVALAVSLASVLMLLAVGLLALPRSSPAPVELAPLAQRQQLRDERLAVARTPQARVKVLDDLARELEAEARDLTSSVSLDRLALVARFYREVVDSLPVEAKEVPADERRQLNDLADRLGRTESDFERLAAQVRGSAAVSLREIAVAAKAADRRLRALSERGV